MAFVELNGHRLEIDRVAGDRRSPTLVFLHEGIGSVSRWRGFHRAVAEATGCRAVAWSRLGYGKSDPAPRPRPVTFMHAEARGPLPALLAAEGIDDAILVGHSDGASIALIHAGDGGPRVRAMALIAPHVFVEPMCVEAIAKIRADYLDASTGVKARLARHHADADGAFLGWADVWLDPAFLRWDITASLPGVKVPVLVIQGDRDEYGTVAQVDAVCEGVAGPRSRVMLRGAGHVPHRDRREDTLAAVTNFVDHFTRPSRTR